MKRREFLNAAGKAVLLAGLPYAGDTKLPAAVTELSSRPASGPLRVHPRNGRYFCDASGRAVLLTGSHMWNNLVDMGRNDPPQALDFASYLSFLDRYAHNFIRLWTWDSSTWDTRANRNLGKDFVHQVSPLPWPRVGPDKALDGKPKFDLHQFDAAYFDRLRKRVGEAGRRGIYVSVMLFEGWGLMHGNRGRAAPEGWAWRSHPFHAENNINGVDAGVQGDPITGRPHSLADDNVNAIQAAYIRKVVDTVNDLDNVLYEVINEGGEQRWDWWVVQTVREYERAKPKQHPIGITGHGAEPLDSMLASPADWISPGRRDGFADDPPAWDGKKVSLLDTDHVWGVGGNRAWVWKSFLRGHNPLFMDPYDGTVLGKPFDPHWEPIRQSLGLARRLAERIDLAAMTPHSALCSTQYCLADIDARYLAFLPNGGHANLNLSTASGKFSVEWFDCSTGDTRNAGTVDGGADLEFTSPLASDSVLHLWR